MALPTASDNPFPSLLITEGTEPAAPAAGKQRLYIDSTSHKLKATNSSGTERDIESTGSNTPGYEFDYVEFTANVNLTATTEGTANVIVTSNAVTYDGSTIVKIEVGMTALYVQATTAASAALYLYEKVGAGAAASIGKMAENVTPAASGMEAAVCIYRRRTPSAASIIYSIRGTTSSGTSIAAAGAGGSGATMPGFIRITRV